MPHYGFNFQWMLVPDGQRPKSPDLRALDFLVQNGFDFVRLPTDYRVWTRGFDYLHPDRSVFDSIDAALEACRERGVHLSLNIHRAPGYCITRNELERDNLWLDDEAQDAFDFLWRTFAERYRGVPAQSLSFDLLNEPPAIGLHGFTRDRHETLIRRTVQTIRAIDPARPIAIDGLDGGNLAMPELADLDVTHSGRGYVPYPVSHWGADWWDGWKEGDSPRYPGLRYQGKTWGKPEIREFFEPWRQVESSGRQIHIGEFGCFNRTPNADALRWFGDLLSLFHEYGWGFAMWNFQGPFGIVGHGREGARIENRNGYDVDADLLELLIAARVR